MEDEGYDFFYCHQLREWKRDHLYDRDVTGVDFVDSLGLENIMLPKTTYAIFVKEI